MLISTLAKSLATHPFVAALPEDYAEFLAGCTRNHRCESGDILFREGDSAEELYLIRNGKIALELHRPAHEPQVLETLHAGQVIGWSTLFPPNSWDADGIAVKDTLLFAIDGICLRNKIEQDPTFGYALAKGLLREVHRRLARARLQSADVYGGRQ